MQTRLIALAAAALSLPLSGITAPAPPQQESANIPATLSAPKATSAKVLALDEAISLAQNANPALRSSVDGVAIADALKIQARSFPNPELSAVREGFDRGSTTQTVQISQRLELGGKRAARVAVAEQDRQLAAKEVAVTRAQLRADVTAAYFEALIAQERAELARASVQLAEKATSAATKRVTAGRISPIEQSRSRVAEATARLELAQAASDARLSRQRLAALWGAVDAPAFTLQQPTARSTTLPPLERLRQQLAGAPQLQRARSQVQREQAQVQLERTQRVPDVTVTVGTKRDDQIDHRQTVIGVAVPLPLFNRNQGNLLAALRRADKAGSDLAAEELRIVQALNEAYQRAQLAQAEVAAMTAEILPIAQNAYESTVTGFEAGKFGFLEVLDTQRTLFQTRAQYLRALAERQRALADIGRYVDLDAIASQ